MACARLHEAGLPAPILLPYAWAGDVEEPADPLVTLAARVGPLLIDGLGDGLAEEWDVARADVLLRALGLRD